MQPILVVSPDPSGHSVWVHLLRDRGYLVRVSNEDCGEGLNFEPSLVIFDLSADKPLTVAWEELETLRAAFPAVPLVMLLPPNLPGSYRRLFENGSNGCLQKPIDYAALVRLVDMFVIRQTEKRRIELGISRMLSFTAA